MGLRGPERARLVRRLAELYPLESAARRLLDSAELPAASVDFAGPALDRWFAAVVESEKHGRLADLITVAILEYGNDAVLQGLLQLAMAELPAVDWPVGVETPSAGTAEKLMGRQSTLRPLSFLLDALRAAKPVAKVRLADGTAGSGFLVADDLLVTNHHVIRSAADAAAARIVLGHQHGEDGRLDPGATHRLCPERGFATSKDDDLTVVRTEPGLGGVWGVVDVAPNEALKGSRVAIIQHPSGGPKQIAFEHNVVTYADARIVHYLTDTLPGSSGSPVFDEFWRLVAVHHQGGNLTEPGTVGKVYRNRGIAVGRLIDLLAALGG